MKTLRGFDAVTQFTPDELQVMRKTYSVAAYYLGGPEATTSQLAYSATLRTAGFVTVPIYVGHQEQRLAGVPDKTVEDMGTESAAQTLSLLTAGHHTGFRGVVLDWESGLTREGRLYATTWAQHVTRAGWTPIAYRPRAGISVAETGFAVWLATLDASLPWSANVAGIQYRQEQHFSHTVDVTLWRTDFIDSLKASPTTDTHAAHAAHEKYLHELHVAHQKYLHDLHEAHLAHLANGPQS